MTIIYYAFTTDKWFIEHYQQLIEQLNDVDKARFDKMKNALKRQQLVLSRALLLQAAQQIIPENATSYQINQYRHLVINNTYHFSLSISHSGNLAAVACTDALESIGIDVERIKTRNIEELSQEVCTEKERVQLLKNEKLQQSFYKLWTMKEALTKASMSDLFQLYACDCSTALDNANGSITWREISYCFDHTELFNHNFIKPNTLNESKTDKHTIKENNYIGSVVVNRQNTSNVDMNKATDVLSPSIKWIHYT